MIRGLYTSALGMNTQMKRLDVVSNNLANVDTTGFKKDTVVTAAFPDELTRRINDNKQGFSNERKIGKMNMGVHVDEIRTNYMQGSMKQTYEMFDLAIQGKGFFVVQTKGKDGQLQEKYTRDGSFTLNADGQLMTKEGNLVLGQNGPIVLGAGDEMQIRETMPKAENANQEDEGETGITNVPIGAEQSMASNANIRVNAEGKLYINDEFYDTLKVVQFEDPYALKKVGDNLLEAQEGAKKVPVEGQVIQGFLEASNVNPIRAMVDMITISRAYESNQKLIQVHDQILSKTVNEVGKV